MVTTGQAVHPCLELIRQRVSVERFRAALELSDAEIRDLVEEAIEARSARATPRGGRVLALHRARV